jgi:hypothetical protein
MSILFSKKGRKAVKVVFGIVAVLVTLSMILMSAPGLIGMF